MACQARNGRGTAVTLHDRLRSSTKIMNKICLFITVLSCLCTALHLYGVVLTMKNNNVILPLSASAACAHSLECSLLIFFKDTDLSCGETSQPNIFGREDISTRPDCANPDTNSQQPSRRAHCRVDFVASTQVHIWMGQ